MPFQALPIALRANTGSPLTKLLWVQLVHTAELTHEHTGIPAAQISPYEAGRFAQCSPAEAIAGWEMLDRLGLISIASRYESNYIPEWFIDVHLPMSALGDDERKRIKASPDQIDQMAEAAGHKCAACGWFDRDRTVWHVDHIIPRSQGGADVELNCQLLCGTCNTRKGARVHWVDFLGGRK
jgi:hypothetical protein